MSEKNKSVIIEPDIDEKFMPMLDSIKQKVRNISRDTERGFVNSHSKSSIVLKENGNVSLISGINSQIKLSKEGKITEICLEKETKTNKKKLTTDDLILNNHKFNPKLFEFTDMRQVLNSEELLVGNFTMSGTVLVKTWDEDRKRYVLIRRPTRLPMFSPILNTSAIPEEFDIDNNLIDDMKDIEERIQQSIIEDEMGD